MQYRNLLAPLALALAVGAGVHTAVAARGRAPAELIVVNTPSGLRGQAVGEADVPLTFLIERVKARSVKVQFEYGFDRNGDGAISDGEFQELSIDRRSPLNTGKSRSRDRFRTAGAPGRMHTIVWDTLADLAGADIRDGEFLRTEQGRLIPDPANSEDFLRDPASQGVVVRARTRKGRGKKRRIGEWVSTQAFSIDNTRGEFATATVLGAQVDLGPDPTENDDVVLVSYELSDPRAEDENDNGLLDLDEDDNRNGELDTPTGGVAVDFYRLEPGEDFEGASTLVLETLDWQPATRFEGAGDPDTGLEATFGGTTYDFAWYAVADQLVRDGDFILRVRPFIQGKLGDWSYLTTPVQPFAGQN